MTTEDKQTIKEAIIEAWVEIQRLNRKRELEAFHDQGISLKDLISSFRTPKPKVDEQQPH